MTCQRSWKWFARYVFAGHVTVCCSRFVRGCSCESPSLGPFRHTDRRACAAHYLRERGLADAQFTEATSLGSVSGEWTLLVTPA